MKARTCLAIVLAAGEGTRMRSAGPRSCMPSPGARCSPMCWPRSPKPGSPTTAVVIGPGHEAVTAEARRVLPRCRNVFVQHERRGTAHAVLAAQGRHRRGADDILMVFGDTPLIRPANAGAAARAVGARARRSRCWDSAPPIRPATAGSSSHDGKLIAIREEADASDSERAIALCNGGLMALAGNARADDPGADRQRQSQTRILSDRRGRDRARHEARRRSRSKSRRMTCAASTPRRNSPKPKPSMQQRLRKAALDAGVTLVAPETVLSRGRHQARPGRHGRALCGVRRPGVTVEDGAIIHSFSHLAGAHVGKGAIVGPLCAAAAGRQARRGRRTSAISSRSRRRVIEAGAKANHLTLYRRRPRRRRRQHRRRHHHLQLRRHRQAPHRHRRRRLHRLELGAGRAGARSASGAYVGSGSVITADVPADALALGRGRQVVKEGWASALARAQIARQEERRIRAIERSTNDAAPVDLQTPGSKRR